jgi:hypothetical protein
VLLYDINEKGKTSVGEKSFNSFVKSSGIKDLLILTNHKKPNIRCYAFYGLVKRNYFGVKEIFKDHVSDSAVVLVMKAGLCSADKQTVVRFMLDKLHPESLDRYKLSRPEFDKYYNSTLQYSSKINPKLNSLDF